MNLKKEVVDRIKAKLIRDQQDLHYDLKKNSNEINRLSGENTIKKRQIAKLGELIKSID